MALRKEKEKALELRKKGMSYSQIKEKLGISKSTLSYWLADHPLSPERISELRDKSPRRIESFRNTMRTKREKRLSDALSVVSCDIGEFSERDIFIAGMFLYWGEGGKTLNTSTVLSNTDPGMMKFYIDWLKVLGVKKKDLRVRLQLYSDMDVESEMQYWSSLLGLSKKQFGKAYIKDSKMCDITYKRSFTHGTCEVMFHGRELNEYVLMGIKYLQEMKRA